MKSARSIQRRLYLLILRAFGAVVLLISILIFGAAALYFTFASDVRELFRPALFGSLEAYYLARGSWDEVENIFVAGAISDFPDIPPRWENTLLLDAQDRLVIDQTGQQIVAVGQVYPRQAGDQWFPLYVRGETVGTVVVRDRQEFNPINLVLRLLVPVIYLSILPAILTVTIGILLTRRVVHPLADVIAAAQSVAAGDLTARVEVRGPQDLHALTDSFNHMADALQRADSERRNMLADVAHELRTPLSVMRGRLEGILDGIYPLEEAVIATVLEETYLLERLVDDLRLLTLAETRQLPFDLRLVDLNELAVRAADLFGPQARDAAITLSLETDPAAWPVHADPQRIEQVIGNMVSNALRYTPRGGLVILRVAMMDNGLTFTVSDDGPGVPQADLPHLFDRFWRGEASRSRAGGGAGLGLAIARQLIEAQGGSVFARNLPGSGLMVGFSFERFGSRQRR
jgi:two-component system OmpR family sensor kinase/two-component system sensor histidine kinase BaeS